MTKPIKRVFLIVLDSFGIGALPDAAEYGDEGSNTLGAVLKSRRLYIPTMRSLGLFNIAMTPKRGVGSPLACFGAMAEKSKGKDTTIGHWELSGVVSPRPLPTYPNGFPKELLDEFEKAVGRGWLCNMPYSGTEVIKDYGREHLETGKYIVYTSADSVFQIAAHEEKIPLAELYDACEKARTLLQGEHGVGRVIARPFLDKDGEFYRTGNRHDYSLLPPSETMLDRISGSGLDVVSIGKIVDIFCGRGITRSIKTKNNSEGMAALTKVQSEDFEGLCFANLVDFDMVYGHRNDIDGYANALSEFDEWLALFLTDMREGDTVIITADHGCDPATPSTDHSREYVPLLVFGGVNGGVDLGVRESFGDVASTVCEMLGVNGDGFGESFYQAIKNVE